MAFNNAQDVIGYVDSHASFTKMYWDGNTSILASHITAVLRGRMEYFGNRKILRYAHCVSILVSVAQSQPYSIDSGWLLTCEALSWSDELVCYQSTPLTKVPIYIARPSLRMSFRSG